MRVSYWLLGEPPEEMIGPRGNFKPFQGEIWRNLRSKTSPRATNKKDKSTESAELLEHSNNEWSIYSNLQKSDEIRLLYLQPGSPGDQIKCTLKHGRFSKQVSYEALSYMWGSEDTVRPILLDGFQFNVRENLLQALQHLRLPSEVRILWIDAICINQRNVRERNYQVTQMGKIYSQARRVVVWLGPSDNASKMAFDTFLPLKPYRHRSAGRPIRPPGPVLILAGRDKVPAISSLLNRAYWKRLWIVQECLMARELVIQCGSDKCSGFEFSWLIDLLRTLSKEEHAGKLAGTRDQLRTPRSIDENIAARLVKQRSDGPGYVKPEPALQSLFKLCHDYNEADCQDQRDKIFGLHSLASPCCKAMNPIDYSLTWESALSNLISHQVTSHVSIPKSVKFGPSDSGVQNMKDFYYMTSRESHNFSSKSWLHSQGGFLHSVVHWADLRPSWTDPSPEPVILSGYVRGRVCYRTPSLRELSTYTDFELLDLELPELTPMLHFQIAYICSLNKPTRIRHPYATSETDLVDIVTKPETFPKVKHCGGHSPRFLSQNPLSYWGNNHFSALYDEKEFSKMFFELLRTARKLPKSNTTSHRLAFEENGLILFAPMETQVGDLVGQFPGSDVLAVIQPHWRLSSQRGYEVFTVMRGVNFLASPSNMAADIYGKPMSFANASPYAISFTAEPEPVRRLCRVSDTPNSKQNSLTTNHGNDYMSLWAFWAVEGGKSFTWKISNSALEGPLDQSAGDEPQSGKPITWREKNVILNGPLDKPISRGEPDILKLLPQPITFRELVKLQKVQARAHL